MNCYCWTVGTICTDGWWWNTWSSSKAKKPSKPTLFSRLPFTENVIKPPPKKNPKFLPKGTSTLTWNFPRKMKRKFEKIERLNLRYTTDFLISHMRGESRTARHLPCLWQVLLKRRGGTTLLRNQFFFQYLRNDDAVGSISWVEQRSRKSSFNEVFKQNA